MQTILGHLAEGRTELLIFSLDLLKLRVPARLPTRNENGDIHWVVYLVHFRLDEEEGSLFRQVWVLSRCVFQKLIQTKL